MINIPLGLTGLFLQLLGLATLDKKSRGALQGIAGSSWDEYFMITNGINQKERQEMSLLNHEAYIADSC
jgi:hypothetical protein